MATKHTVTDSRGKVHTRTSEERVYSYAIVGHYPAHTDKPARDRACWAATRKLAEKTARNDFRHAESVEIIKAERVGVRGQYTNADGSIRSGAIGIKLHRDRNADGSIR